MFQAIKRSDSFNSFFRIQSAKPQPMPPSLVPPSRSISSVLRTSLLILVTVLLINWITEDFLARVIILSVIGLLLGNLVTWWNHAFVLKVGGVLILVIMAILSLRLDFARLSLPIAFAAVCIIWIIARSPAWLTSVGSQPRLL
jgi:hypothetical protein